MPDERNPDKKSESLNALIGRLDTLSEVGNGWNPQKFPKTANEQEIEFRNELAIAWPTIRNALLGGLPTARPSTETLQLDRDFWRAQGVEACLDRMQLMGDRLAARSHTAPINAEEAGNNCATGSGKGHATRPPEVPVPSAPSTAATPETFNQVAIRHAKELDVLRAKLAAEIKNKKQFERDWLEACDQLATGTTHDAPVAAPSAPSAIAPPGALTFDAFRRANVARCLKWHPAGIASWSPSDWLTAVTGELGELASLLKMRNRERDGLPGNKFSPTDKQIADELADVLTYLDLLAEVLGVDLGAATVTKFNEVSKRVGFPDRIAVSDDNTDGRKG